MGILWVCFWTDLDSTALSVKITSGAKLTSSVAKALLRSRLLLPNWRSTRKFWPSIQPNLAIPHRTLRRWTDHGIFSAPVREHPNPLHAIIPTRLPGSAAMPRRLKPRNELRRRILDPQDVSWRSLLRSDRGDQSIGRRHWTVALAQLAVTAFPLMSASWGGVAVVFCLSPVDIVPTSAWALWFQGRRNNFVVCEPFHDRYFSRPPVCSTRSRHTRRRPAVKTVSCARSAVRFHRTRRGTSSFRRRAGQERRAPAR